MVIIVSLENTEKNTKEKKTAHPLTIQRSPLLIYQILLLQTRRHTEHTVMFPMQLTSH